MRHIEQWERASKLARKYAYKFLASSKRFDRLALGVRLVLWQGAAIMLMCFVGVTGLCVSKAVGQAALLPSTVYESQQYDRVQLNEHMIDEAKQKLLDDEASSKERRADSAVWKTQLAASLQESRERQNRDEGVGIGAFSIIGILQAMGWVRKFQSEDGKLAAVTKAVVLRTVEEE